MNKAREKARAAGLKTYLGRQCEYGHDGERRVINDGCCECIRQRAREYQRTDEVIERRRTPEQRTKRNERRRARRKSRATERNAVVHKKEMAPARFAAQPRPSSMSTRRVTMKPACQRTSRND